MALILWSTEVETDVCPARRLQVFLSNMWQRHRAAQKAFLNNVPITGRASLNVLPGPTLSFLFSKSEMKVK